MADALYTVRTPDGLELGPVRPETVVDLILNKKILGNETVSANGGEWQPLQNVEQFRKAVDKREGRLAANEAPPISSAAQTDLDDLDDLAPPGEKVDISLDDSVPGDAVEEVEEILDDADVVEERIDLDSIDDALEDAHLPENPPAKPVQVPPAATPAAKAPAAAARPAATDMSDGGIEIDLEDDVLDAEPVEEEVLELETLELAGVQELEVLEVKPQASKAGVDVREELRNPNNRYTIRNSDGLVLGPVRVATLRDLIQAGAVAVSAEIQKNNDPWKPLAGVPELLFLYDQIKSAE